MPKQKSVDLRVCASCEFIFSQKEYQLKECPICAFATYGAYYVYGQAAYSYKKNQKPFFDKLISFNTSKAIAEGNALIQRAESVRRQKFLKLLNIK